MRLIINGNGSFEWENAPGAPSEGVSDSDDSARGDTINSSLVRFRRGYAG